MLLNAINYARNEMPDAFADIKLGARGTEVAALGEIMRRMSYVPDPRNLMDAMAKWRGRFPITDPKEAARQYRAMAADMNEPMVTALQTALERRAAGLPQVDWKKEFKWVPNGFDDGGMWETTDAWDTREGKEARALQVREEERAAEQRARMGADLAASDEPMEAIVGRLLETAPLTDERWGGW